MALTKVSSGLISADASSVDLNIDAGTLYIDATNNRVGVGTTSPSAELHVKAASGFSEIYFQGASSTSGSYLFDNGTESGIYKVDSGYMAFGTSNTERMRIDSSGNVTIQSSGELRIRDDGTFIKEDQGLQIGNTSGTGTTRPIRFFTESTERMRIDSSGNIGMTSTAKLSIANLGTQTAHYLKYDSGVDGLELNGWGGMKFTRGTNGASETMRLSGTDLLLGWTGGTYNDPGYNNTDGISLRGSSYSSTFIIAKTDSSAVPNIISYRRGNNSNGYHVLFEHGGTVGTINTTYGSSTSYNTTSDYRLKENVVEMEGAIDRVKLLQPKRFNFIADETDTTVDGFLAHEVQDIVPEAIHGVKDEVDEEGNPVYQGIDQSKLVPLLTKAIQELSNKVDNQQTLIEQLQAEVALLKGE